MAAVPVLADPSVMTAQERTDELAASIARDDLLAVLLVMIYCGVDEVNGAASTSNRTPLETALLTPTVRTPVRRLIVECLLHRGASVAAVLQHPPRDALPAILSVVTRWNAGGRDEATTAYSLCFTMQLNQAEPFIGANGFGPDGPVDPPAPAPPPAQTNGASPAEASSSHAGLHGPPSHEASTSSHRRDSTAVQTGTSVGPSPALAAPISDNWICVANIPMSLAERWIFDKLERNRVHCVDIFLSKAHNKSARFAFVGFHGVQAGSAAVRVLHNLPVHGGKLVATPFFDRMTGSRKPKISDADILARRYIGAHAQAALAPFERRHGLFFLHLSPHTTSDNVHRFLERSLPASEIGFIEVRKSGLSFIAFADVATEDACRKAIIDLDGEALDGYAVRITWLERESLWRPPSGALADFAARRGSFRSTDHHTSPPSLTRQLSEHEPINKPILHETRRETRTGDTGGPPSTCKRNEAPASSNSTAAHAAKAPFPPPPAELPPPAAVSKTRASPSSSSSVKDVERLRSLGLTPQQIGAIQHMWRPLDESPTTSTTVADEPFDRTINVQVRFGFVPQEVAKKALRENDVAPTYLDDRVKQARYEAFLAAQAGESRTYYTVFFAQLAEFNASSSAFAEAARSAAARSTQGTNGTMQVDEEVVKKEHTP
ncbi:hypothetical protein JCM10450v2_002030 [Rhodotorula kratochvilovae]